MLPPGSLIYTGVSLNSISQLDGVIPFNGEVPTAFVENTDPLTVSIPGGLDGATILLENKAKNATVYKPTIDGRTIAEQVGEYGTLISDNKNTITVVLPPDVGQFITSNSTIKSAASVLEALLLRVDEWSKEGFLNCSRILRAISRLMAGYRKAETDSTAQTVELHIYLAHLKRLFMAASVFFGARANEASGTSSPLVLDSSRQIIDVILGADGNGYIRDPNVGMVVGDSVYVPGTGFIDELLVSIVKGILIAD